MSANQYLFISNKDLNHRKGGWDGYGGKIYDIVKENFPNVSLLEPIDPPMQFRSRLRSKLLRSVGIPANYPIFSKARLRCISKTLEEKVGSFQGEIIFHGATSWSYYEPRQTYYVVIDSCFLTYMKVYHNIEQYSARDIQRVAKREARFLDRAAAVFFTSDWGLEEAKKEYGLKGNNFICSGLLSTTAITPPRIDIGKVRNQFLMIATNFLAKGGAEICRSFSRLLEVHPDYRLIIVGDRPPDAFLAGKNIEYLGYIDKSTDEGSKKLESLYQQSKALLYLTTRDIAPLVIIEGGLQGCPSIANAMAAIGDTIIDGQTGFLISNNEDEMFGRMISMASMSQEEHLNMRTNAYRFLSENFDWSRTTKKVVKALKEHHAG